MADKVTFTPADKHDDEVFHPEPRLGARMIYEYSSGGILSSDESRKRFGLGAI